MDIEELKSKIQKAYSEWEKNSYQKSIERNPERQSKFTSVSFRQIAPIYSPLNTELENYLEKINFPGNYPFTRGVQPSMYRGKLWTMRQYAGFGTASETNQRFKFLLSQGQMGLSVAFDLPTQIGYDSDHPMASGEVGKVGVAIDTLADMEILFNEIPLDKVSTSMTINAQHLYCWLFTLQLVKNKVFLKIN
mgnify:CR=1 FL=1